MMRKQTLCSSGVLCLLPLVFSLLGSPSPVQARPPGG